MGRPQPKRQAGTGAPSLFPHRCATHRVISVSGRTSQNTEAVSRLRQRAARASLDAAAAMHAPPGPPRAPWEFPLTDALYTESYDLSLRQSHLGQRDARLLGRGRSNVRRQVLHVHHRQLVGARAIHNRRASHRLPRLPARACQGVRVRMHVRVCACACACACACVCVCMCACACACVHVHVCTCVRTCVCVVCTGR